MGTLSCLIVAITLALLGRDGTLAPRSASAPQIPQIVNPLPGRPMKWRGGIVGKPSHLTPDRVHGGIGP
jgi:hypothetical protein